MSRRRRRKILGILTARAPFSAFRRPIDCDTFCLTGLYGVRRLNEDRPRLAIADLNRGFVRFEGERLSRGIRGGGEYGRGLHDQEEWRGAVYCELRPCSVSSQYKFRDLSLLVHEGRCAVVSDAPPQYTSR